MLYHVQGRQDATSFSNDTLSHEYLESGKRLLLLEGNEVPFSQKKGLHGFPPTKFSLKTTEL